MVNVIDVAFNLCLIVLFAVVVAHAWVFYQLKRNRLYLYVIGIFALYIVDELVIYMTEALDLFGSKYNELFMSSPSVKTVLYIGMAVFMILIQNALFRKPFTATNGVILIIFGLWLLFIPMLPHGDESVAFLPAVPDLHLLFLPVRYAVYEKEAPAGRAAGRQPALSLPVDHHHDLFRPHRL